MYIYIKIQTIATSSLHIETFKKNFKTNNRISVNDIFAFYKKQDNTVKKTTVNWRIYKLVDKGVIQRIGRGLYKLGEQKEFAPLLSENIKSLYADLKKEYPYLDMCIWSTNWLVQWMQHIPGNYETIIELEKGAEENSFYYLSSQRENVFLNPTQDILDKYAKDTEEITIIKSLVTDAPLQTVDEVQIPTLEKILVDLIVNTGPYYAYEGRDLDSIIENAFEYNTINLDKLYRYATRRGKRNIVATKLNTVLRK